MGNEAEVQKIKNRLLQTRREGDGLLPVAISNSVAVDRHKIEGYPMYRLIPERAKGNIFYLYSSDLVRPIQTKEWQFILNLCQLTNMAVTVPIYPIAPEHDCEDVFAFLLPAYQYFSKHREEGPIILMGCGAGAGLALSLQLITWREGLPDPDKLVFLSPQLDTEFFDPEILASKWKPKKTVKRFLQISSEDLKETFGGGGFSGEDLPEKRGGKKKASPDVPKLARKGRTAKRQFEVRKEFLDLYWVKNFAGRTEYTSPIYADLTDICKDVLVISGTEDQYNPYARRLTEKLLDLGTEPKFFEYRDMPREFFLRQGSYESRHCMKVLHDLLLDTDTAIINLYMEEVRARADWSKWFPEIFKDERAMRYVSMHPKVSQKKTWARNIFTLMGAATQRAHDDAVRLFLQEYPNGTVVYVGCRLDTMMERVDNGRVIWYDLDSPGLLAVRSLYTDRLPRERRVDRSMNDLSWMKQLNLEMDKGVLFIIKNTFSYMTWEGMREFLDQLYRNFQGCNVIFDMATPRTRRMLNFFTKRSGADYRRRKLSMKDPRREIEQMNPVYSVVSVKSVLDGVKPGKDWKLMLRWNLWSNQRRESRKIVHLRLGYERYKTF